VLHAGLHVPVVACVAEHVPLFPLTGIKFVTVELVQSQTLLLVAMHVPAVNESVTAQVPVGVVEVADTVEAVHVSLPITPVGVGAGVKTTLV
jgi:hypothetical protein